MELKRRIYAGNKRSHRSGRSSQKNNLNCLYRSENSGIRKGKIWTPEGNQHLTGIQDESANMTEMRQKKRKKKWYHKNQLRNKKNIFLEIIYNRKEFSLKSHKLKIIIQFWLLFHTPESNQTCI